MDGDGYSSSPFGQIWQKTSVGKKMVDRHSQTTDDLFATRFFCLACRSDCKEDGKFEQELTEITETRAKISVSSVISRSICLRPKAALGLSRLSWFLPFWF